MYELQGRRNSQADQAGADLAEISDDLDFIKAQLARLPIRRGFARLVLLATLSAGALVLLMALLPR